MRVRMEVGLSGPAINLSPGDEHEFPDAEAVRLIAAGYAVPAEAREIEMAVEDRVAERRGKRKRD